MSRGSRSASDSRKYIICHQDIAFSAGSASHRLQVLMGLLYPEIVAVFFDGNGKFLRVESRTVPVSAPRLPSGVAFNLGDPAFVASYRSALSDWKQTLGFSPDCITISKFFIDDRFIGIKDRPDHLQEIVDNPDELDEIADSDDEKEEYLASVDVWDQEQKFVLWWGKDYWMTRDGEIDST